MLKAFTFSTVQSLHKKFRPSGWALLLLHENPMTIKSKPPADRPAPPGHVLPCCKHKPPLPETENCPSCRLFFDGLNISLRSGSLSSHPQKTFFGKQVLQFDIHALKTLTGDPTNRVKVCAEIWSDQPNIPAVFTSFQNQCANTFELLLNCLFLILWIVVTSISTSIV